MSQERGSSHDDGVECQEWFLEVQTVRETSCGSRREDPHFLIWAFITRRRGRHRRDLGLANIEGWALYISLSKFLQGPAVWIEGLNRC